MKQIRIIALLALPAVMLAQKKEQFVEMQRDIALLQDQVKTLERSQTERLAALEKLLNQIIANQGAIRESISKTETSLTAAQKNLVTPVASIGSKMEEMSIEVGGFKNQMADINASIRKMQSQMVDMSNAIKVLQAPPAPPTAADPTGPPAGMTSESLFEGALRARSAGQYDLAMQQFMDYLRYYGQTPQAASAQFHIGEVHYNQQQFAEAARAFDTTIERYPNGEKTLDAHYMKGMALLKMDQKAEALAEFRALVKSNPNSEQAAKARDQISRLAPASKKRR